VPLLRLLTRISLFSNLGKANEFSLIKESKFLEYVERGYEPPAFCRRIVMGIIKESWSYILAVEKLL
jgi:hypothetical protein